MNIKNQKVSPYIVIILLTTISLIFSGCRIVPPVPKDANWTVMVYLAAGNDLETVGIQDINEMEMVGSTKEVNIVVQIDRIPFKVLNQIALGMFDDSSNNDFQKKQLNQHFL